MRLYEHRKKILTVTIFFLSCLFSFSLCYAGADPSIRDWGSPPGSPPLWQTSDIWVDNNGNEGKIFFVRCDQRLNENSGGKLWHSNVMQYLKVVGSRVLDS